MLGNLFTNKRGAFFGNFSLTNKLILINIGLFLIFIFAISLYGEQFILDNFALVPADILEGRNLWALVTSMFLHAGFFHLFANMFSLFFVGNFLEKIIGKKRFIVVYLVSGLVGGIFFVSLAYLGETSLIAERLFGNIGISGVGASGAIFGLLGVLAVLVPNSKIYLIMGPLIVLILMVLFPQFAILWNILIFAMIFSMLSFNSRLRKLAVPLELPMWLLPFVAIVPLIVISFFVNLPIGNSAHIGGLMFGLFYGAYLMRKFPKKIGVLRRHFR